MMRPAFTILILALAAVAVPASATSVYCSSCTYSPSQFATDTSVFSMTALTFSGAVDPTTGYSELGVVFTDYMSGQGTSLSISSGSLTDNHTPVAGMNITLPSTTTAVSFYLVGGSGQTINVSGANVPSTALIMTGSPVFFGAVAGTGTQITSLAISSSNQVTINGFETFAPGASAPEAPTLALIGSGLVGLAFVRRRRRIQQPDAPTPSLSA